MSASDIASPLAAPVAAATAQSPAAAVPAPAPQSGQSRPAETPVAKSEPPFPEHRVLLRIDEATQIIQARVRDADSGKVLYDLPDDQWLRLAAKLRAFAATAIVDKSV
ncbi:flagellar protein FlaG [Solidesulfovibrio sp.]